MSINSSLPPAAFRQTSRWPLAPSLALSVESLQEDRRRYTLRGASVLDVLALTALQSAVSTRILGRTMRDAVINKERWERRRTPTQDPSTDVAAQSRSQEVYLRKRMMMPTPREISAHADFEEVGLC